MGIPVLRKGNLYSTFRSSIPRRGAFVVTTGPKRSRPDEPRDTSCSSQTTFHIHPRASCLRSDRRPKLPSHSLVGYSSSATNFSTRPFHRHQATGLRCDPPFPSETYLITLLAPRTLRSSRHPEGLSETPRYQVLNEHRAIPSLRGHREVIEHGKITVKALSRSAC